MSDYIPKLFSRLVPLSIRGYVLRGEVDPKRAELIEAYQRWVDRHGVKVVTSDRSTVRTDCHVLRDIEGKCECLNVWFKKVD